MNKEKWINEVMNSAANMQRAQPPADLHEKIMRAVNNPKQGKSVPFPAIKWAAAAALLLSLNIGSFIYAVGQGKKTAYTSNAATIAAEMQLESTYNY